MFTFLLLFYFQAWNQQTWEIQWMSDKLRARLCESVILNAFLRLLNCFEHIYLFKATSYDTMLPNWNGFERILVNFKYWLGFKTPSKLTTNSFAKSSASECSIILCEFLANTLTSEACKKFSVRRTNTFWFCKTFS